MDKVRSGGVLVYTKGEAEEKAPKDYLPVLVSSFDSLLDRHGFERGSTILVAGGCGTGKTTFTMQSLYNGLLNGEKAIYITFEEPPEKIIKHVYESFKWDLKSFEQEGKFAIIKMDPFKISRKVEAELLQKSGKLMIEVEEFNLPFNPDRIVVDSLSALEIAFKGSTENYRIYIRYLFDILDKYNSVNFVITETELGAEIYSKGGIEEFLADGVIIMYNFMVKEKRERTLEIIKLRFSDHVKKLVPFKITKNGIVIEQYKAVEDLLILASSNKK